MTVEEVQLNDVGTIIEITVIEENNSIVDLSSATTKQIKILKPSGAIITEDADFVTNGTDGKLKYTIQAGDLNEIGLHRVQAYLVLAYWTGHTGAEEKIYVCSNLVGTP